MNIRNIKCEAGSLFLIVIIVCSALLTNIILNPESNSAVAASNWIQTSDVDFNNGTLDNLTIEGSGPEAQLKLELSELKDWVERKNLSPKPSAMYSHGMASIWGTDKVIVFGGLGSSYWNATWVYDLSDNTWKEKKPKVSPSSRWYPTLASITGDDKVLLFGGYYLGYLNETWVYDLSDNTWVDKTPPNPGSSNYPVGRYGHGMTAISNDDKVLMFGGRDSIGYRNDLWLYDLSDNSWVEKTPTGSKPGIRYNPPLASISSTDKVLLFGGNTTMDDTWCYDLSDNKWTEMMKGPPARTNHKLTTIFGTHCVILFGGYSYGYKDDTWVFDLDGGTTGKWVQKGINDKPPGRYRHGLAGVYGTHKVVLFGGYGYPSGYQRDTWIYDHYLNTKNGSYVSGAYDTGSNSSFLKISCNAHVPDNTTIKIQIRTGAEEKNLDSKPFLGPDGTIATFYSPEATSIWEGHNGDRWIQYIVYFNITQVTSSPMLKDLTITYNCLPRTIVIGPTNNSLISNNKPVFKWTFEDKDADKQKAFQILIDDDIEFDEVQFDSGEQTTPDQNWEFPSGTGYTELPDGKWYWKVRTKDPDDFWTEYSKAMVLLIDTHAPSSATSYPINDGYYNSLTEISGIANDAVPGSGITKIEISIKRLNNNHYWNGSAWIPLNTWLTALGTDNWTYDSSLVEWTSGMKYRIQTRATDNVNNIEMPNMENIFTIDKENPTSKINKPVENTWLNNLNTISGSARDYGGAGVDSIEISIMCAEDFISWDDGAKVNQFWSGAEWVKEKNWLTASGTTQWDFNASGIKFTTGDHYIIQSRAIDKTDNVEKQLSEITFMYDAKPPEELAIHINKNDEYTNLNGVVLSLQADDPCSGLYQMAFSTDSAVWSDWEPFNNNRTFELSAADGKKTIYFKVKDFTGNTAEPVSDTIILDTTPPEDLSIIIEDDSKYTTVKRLKLTLKATDKLSGVSEFSYSYNEHEWAPWEPITNVRYLKLPDMITDGEVTIHYKVKDKVGNIAEPVSDSIILDTLPPYSLSILINKGEVETNSTTVTLELYALDNTSGVDQLSFSTDGETWSNWKEFDESTLFLLSTSNGLKTIYFKVKDKAGNIAKSVSDSIILNITTEQQTSNIETKASEDSNIWIILLVVIIIIMFLILISMLMILKRKKRSEAEQLAPGALTIRPGSLSGPVISIGQMKGTLDQPQLPGSVGVYSAPQDRAIHTPLPALVKSTQPISQQVQPTSSPSVVPQALPALPPAQIPKIQSAINTANIQKTSTKPPFASSTQQPPKIVPTPKHTLANTSPSQVKPTVSKPTVDKTTIGKPQPTQQTPNPTLKTNVSPTPTSSTTTSSTSTASSPTLSQQKSEPQVAPKTTVAQSNTPTSGPSVHLPNSTTQQNINSLGQPKGSSSSSPRQN